MTVLSILDVTSACEGFIRPLREGDEVLNAGFVVSVGKKETRDSILHVQALVIRTSGISSEHPYQVDIFVDMIKEYGSKMSQEENSKCECPAGRSEKCKHIMAVMIYLTRLDEMDLEDLSCTDTEQQWGALKGATLKQYEAKRLSELCHVYGQKDVYAAEVPSVNKDMESRWRERLMRCKPSFSKP